MPAPLMTPAFLASLRAQPHLPRHCWYFVAGVTLSALNRPDEIPAVLASALGEGRRGTGGGTGTEAGTGQEQEEDGGEGESRLRIARKMREALVKAAVVGGLPKTINALHALKPSTPASLLDLPPHSPTSRPTSLLLPPTPILHRGAAFFSRTYGQIAPRVQAALDESGTPDLGATARLLYAHVLSETAVLTPVETSWVLLAGLVPQDVNAQLKGHLRGACNHGARVEEVRAVRAVVVRICEGVGMGRVGEGEGGGWGWRGEVANL